MFPSPLLAALLENLQEGIERFQEKFLSVVGIASSPLQLGLLPVNIELEPNFLFHLKGAKPAGQLNTLLVRRHPEIKHFFLVHCLMLLA